jgi:exodeoxyribonuclease V alpha subunit
LPRAGTRPAGGGSHADLFCVPLKGEQDRAFERLVLEGQGTRPKAIGIIPERLREQRPAPAAALKTRAGPPGRASVLQAFEAFQLLCAVRKGPWGVEGLNQRITRALLCPQVD